jgi:PAS domain S-box-containing protein
VTERERRDQRLQRSEQRYRTLAENFPRGVVSLFDADLWNYLVEGGVFEYIDLAGSDFEGRSVSEVHSRDYVERFADYFEAVFDGDRHTFEFTHDGRAYRTRLVPVTAEDGVVVSGMTMTTDITELKDRERDLERYETVVRTVPDGVFVVDASGAVLTANSGGAEMLGYDVADLEGRPIDDLAADGVFGREVYDRYVDVVEDLRADEADSDPVTYTYRIDPIGGDRTIVEAHERLDRLIDDVLELARQDKLVEETEPVALADAARATDGSTVDDGTGSDDLAVVEGRTPESQLANLGVNFERFHVSGTVATIAAMIPDTVGVRPVIHLVREAYPGTRFSVEWGDDALDRDPGLGANVAALLTDRQSEALEVAWRSSYFEKDRETNLSEMAESQPVSRWTFSNTSGWHSANCCRNCSIERVRRAAGDS